MKKDLNSYYLLDKVISLDDCHFFYNYLKNSNVWSLDRMYPNLDITYPHIAFNKNENSSISYLIRSLIFALNSKLSIEHKFTLPFSSFERCTINAQKKGDPSKMHVDGDSDQVSVIFFITPMWLKEFGGGLQIKEKEVEFEPGRCVVFNSNILHDALPIKQETVFYRISIAMHFKII
jgi:hypothetical protein